MKEKNILLRDKSKVIKNYIIYLKKKYNEILNFEKL
jgi:hypothetical protein